MASPSQASSELIARVARELGVSTASVHSTLALFAEGSTLPFIARYRKEATGGLDEVQLRDVRDRAEYITDMEERRSAVLKSIDEQGKMTDALRAQILAADTKQAIEDLYLPFKPKRRTRAMIARERGLGALADTMWGGEQNDSEMLELASTFVSEERDVPSVEAALQGARDILAEQVADDATVRGWIRDVTRRKGQVRSTVIKDKATEDSKFKDYFDYSEAIVTIPSHRMLAIRRGEAEGQLQWRVEAPVDEINQTLTREVIGDRKAAAQLALVAADAYKRIVAMAIEVELRVELKTRADDEAITIFGRNLEQLLLSAPAGEKSVLGLDPGFRTGVKVAAVSATGALVHTDTIYLHQEDRFSESIRTLVARLSPDLIAIGNGTASRETETLVRNILRDMKVSAPQVVVVNEAGASVYSASDLARAEFPALDVSLRGAVSIARRLQDPLAELVKIDPKSIGVGQYQHDVQQTRLKARLDEVVGSCVNRVGVEVNTASAALLSYVAGIGPGLAQSIVALRDERGRLPSRAALRDVPRLGAKAFEQAAGFLRVRGGTHPLDASGVHPERYALVQRMAGDLGVDVATLIGNDVLLEKVTPAQYVSDDVGLPTLRDILSELKKPGRDPRAAFEPPAFRDDLTKPSDLLPGMVLEGVVTNIVAFGAFVDVGVHQDGLVHVSQIADRFIRDPNEIVSVGMRVKVTVQSVDIARGRIALSMRRAPIAAAPVPRATKMQPTVPVKGTVASNGMRFK
ncbi:MAG: RNA-binding transcriptional accessory protein [Gemmatimonadota bacterium]|nr:RNA-binding transcriptional accessory protein [Gemmatimonadota bacterium]